MLIQAALPSQPNNLVPKVLLLSTWKHFGVSGTTPLLGWFAALRIGFGGYFMNVP
mgnify:CR=1 FL=1